MRLRVAIAVIAALAAVFALAAIASARMASTKLGPTLCETTGGGKFVPIPGFPGEKIDRRLLNDVRFLEKRYKIFVTDGYSMDDVHSLNGEHPLGLGLDIVPNKAAGGTWNDIDRLAKWAEPKQNHPRLPFRWVGYDGDANHGRGNHLHLSFGHSETKPGTPAKLVQTIRCPDPVGGGTPQPPTQPDPPDQPDPPEEEPDKPNGPATGGATSGGGGNGGGHGTGGIGGKLGLAPPVIEAGGVGL